MDLLYVLVIQLVWNCFMYQILTCKKKGNIESKKEKNPFWKWKLTWMKDKCEQVYVSEDHSAGLRDLLYLDY